jgi:hypothetical protein
MANSLINLLPNSVNSDFIGETESSKNIDIILVESELISIEQAEL